jgi:hypothetical protein
METPGVRYLTPEILRFLREEHAMGFVAGPRQAGKTTLARHLLTLAGTDRLYFNWDIDTHRKLIVRYPGDFWQRQEIASGNTPPRMVLDEIHKFPRWKRFLKGLYDEHRGNIEIIVTGSGRLDIYQRGGDSLFGRYHLYHLHPFTLGEILADNRASVLSPDVFWQRVTEGNALKGAEQRLADIEKFTGFPEPLFSSSEMKLRRWRLEHRTLVLREDLRDLTRIRDLGIVDTLAMLLPERVGTPVSINAMSEDLQVNFATVKGYLETLSRLYYLFALRPFAGRMTRTLRQAEKIYLFDYTEIGNPGTRFENLVAVHLRKLVDAWNDWGYGQFGLYYVRDREKREVDFLVTEQRKPYALIETKLSGSDIDPSLRYFADRLKPRYVVQVVRNPGREGSRMNVGGILLVGASRFLSFV